MGFKRRSRESVECPSCTGHLVPIVFGFPGPALDRSAERGRVVLGGCNLPDLIPTHHCRECGVSFIRQDGRSLALDVWCSPLAVITTSPTTRSVLLRRGDQTFLFDVDEDDPNFHYFSTLGAPDNPAILLRAGVSLWNAWREGRPELEPELTCASLAGADLRSANLEQAHLDSANLAGADLRDAILCFADLENAVLHRSGTSVAEAVLDGADLTGAVVDAGALDDASTKGATLPADYTSAPDEPEE